MGKQVITVDYITKTAQPADKIIQLKSTDCIVTPGAMDKIEELGLRFLDSPATDSSSPSPTGHIPYKHSVVPQNSANKSAPPATVQGITDHICTILSDQLPQSKKAEVEQLIKKIVQAKLAISPAGHVSTASPASPVQQEQNAVVSMHGNVSMINSRKVFAEQAKIDIPGKVSISDAIRCHPESSHQTTYMQWEKASLDRVVEDAEINLVVEGELELTVDGKILKGHPGDIFFMTKGAKVTYHTDSSVKLACVNV